MRLQKIKCYAKINISLNIINKLKSNFHRIKSIISFINLYDLIFIKKIKSNNHKIVFTGKFSKGIKKQNSIDNLLKILDKNNLLENKKFYIKIIKNIPQESGMAGGSMNASSVINFLVRKKFLKATKKKIQTISNLIGSDVILGVNQNNKYINDKHNLIKIVRRTGLNLVITKPNFGCSTKMIYSSLKLNNNVKISKKFTNNRAGLVKLKNDLEIPAFKKYPKLKKLKLYLSNLPNVYFVRMTGSGSSIIAYFLSKKDALKAQKSIKKNYKNYWCIISKTI